MEVQDERSRVALPLSWVGFRGVVVRVDFNTPEGPLALDLRVDAGVAIGPDRRGAHLSRNIEALVDALEASGPFRSIEDYVSAVAGRLLERHPYAPRARASAETVIHVNLEGPGFEGLEPARARVGVELSRSGSRLWLMTVSVAGITVCPSAMRTIARLAGSLDGFTVSHSQRVIVTGHLKYRRGFLKIEDVARALWGAPSAPAFTLLKRSQEAALVLEAHRNPKLAEDVARDALASLARLARARGLPSDTYVRVEVDSQESIHPQNVYATAEGVLGELEELIDA